MHMNSYRLLKIVHVNLISSRIIKSFSKEKKKKTVADS